LLPGTDCCDENGGIAAAPNARFPFAQRSLSVFSELPHLALGLIPEDLVLDKDKSAEGQDADWR
jgi:hypothetical protein